jgi:exodeoxyribonuclease VII large subunit
MAGFISVGELNDYIAQVLGVDEFLSDFWLKGEISGFKYYRQSGHMYFSLKDEKAAVSCVMFKSSNQNLKFEPADGMEVLARAYVSVYSKQGKYQVYVREMQPYGIGEIYLQLEQLKKKLEARGYFSPENKKPIPAMVNNVGIVTSQDGAALKDILRVIKLRHSNCNIIIAHSQVQGEDAPAALADAIRLINRQGQAEVIIVGRGGGSFEDLMAFNTEQVVEAIYNSRIPVISAVGHEVDFTLADLAADVRAATPTQAANLAVPDINCMIQDLGEARQRMDRLMERRLGQYSETLDHLMLRKIWREPGIIRDRKVLLSEKQNKMSNLIEQLMQNNLHRLQLAADALHNLSPLKVLRRGYAVVYKDDKILRSIKETNSGDELKVYLQDGILQVQVSGKEVLP